MKWSWAHNASIGTAALLLPFMAVPESHVQTGTANTAASATAHVNFKIIIPPVLYLGVAGGNDRIEGADTVAVMSNSRNVTLSATVRTSGDARGNLILSAPGRKLIAQDTRCALGNSHAAAAFTPARGDPAAAAGPLVCTASMP
jgi:hypothetical protein